MTNPTPEAIEALVNRLRGAADYEAFVPSLHREAADMLTALSQPDPTGGWCSDMEAAMMVAAAIDRDPATFNKALADTDATAESLVSHVFASALLRYSEALRITPPVRGQEKE